METLILSICNWLHALATVIWIGGIVLFPFVIMPAAGAAIGQGPVMGKFMEAFAKKFKPLAYLSMVIFLITGVCMMLLNASYEGLGNFNNTWSLMMLIKHIVVAVLIVIGIYMGEVNAKRIGKLMAGAKDGPPPPEVAKYQNLQMNLAKTNVFFSIIVLLLTGIASAV